MKTFIAAVALVGFIGGYYIVTSANKSLPSNTIVPMPISTTTSGAPTITPIEHASLVLKWPGAGSISMYVDPVGGAAKFAGQPSADFILVTDIHGDHFSTSTLADLLQESTTLLVPQAVKEQLSPQLASRATVIENGVSRNFGDFTITAVPMYNLPDSSNAKFHTKGRGNGYLIARNGFQVYVAGDTAATPEMKALSGIDVAFVPMNLPYTMPVEDAAEAVLAFKPKTVYPYHYRGTDGLSDVNKFKELVNTGNPNIEVVLAEWYPEQ